MSNTLVEQPDSGSQTGSPCVACRLPLPIQPAPVSEEGEYWHCKKCNTRHHGVLLTNAPAEIAENVVPGEKKKHTKSEKPKEKPAKPTTKDALPAREPVQCDLETEISRSLDKVIDGGRVLGIEVKGLPFSDSVKSHGVNPYDTLIQEQFAEQYDQSTSQVEDLVVSLEESAGFDVKSTEQVTRESLARAAQDMDLFVKLGINPPDRNYSGKHNYHVAMLACSMAANMGWDQQNISDVGFGCLVHDIGMSRVPKELTESSQFLSAGEFADIARHPVYTFDLLENSIEDIPVVSRMIAYQIHERCDGSGYPRNRKGSSIHEAARLAAVADVYLALVSPRPHRPAMMPHYAVKHLLFGVRDGKFDSEAVRALLRTISAFPIGSYLELKDGRIGRVLRARADYYARPLIETWAADQLDGPPQIVDLSEQPQLEVLKPIASPHQSE